MAFMGNYQNTNVQNTNDHNTIYFDTLSFYLDTLSLYFDTLSWYFDRIWMPTFQEEVQGVAAKEHFQDQSIVSILSA